ncbi:MAG: type II toxin-antitoxin system HicA family toxin [Acidobacteria bacterium]|jgi:predicted RNA binding protein YcfA (HicA-like mRNA interferase family)|nr:type II toxin-antitoxin system HicA family toxin [Acidobacteriota bacterium]
MKKLPRDLPAKKIISVLEHAGFSVDRVTGSHYILIKGKLRTVVPYHKSIKIGTLKSILNQIEMSVEEFQKLL